MPESILNVTPIRNPYYNVEVTATGLDGLAVDAHANEIATRESMVTYTSKTHRPTASEMLFNSCFVSLKKRPEPPWISLLSKPGP